MTGRSLGIKAFEEEGNIHVLILDGEVAQAEALGDWLAIVYGRGIEDISLRNPLTIVQSCLKTCSIHWDRYDQTEFSLTGTVRTNTLIVRNINDMPEAIPQDIINRMKGFVGLNSHEAIDEWHSILQDSPFEEVRSK